MRNAYRYLAMAIGTCVVIQAAAIAFAMFGLAHDVDSNHVVVDKNYDGNFGFALHAIVGQVVIPLLAIALLVIGILIRSVPGAVRWSAIVLGLVVLQIALAFASFGVPVMGLFHGINAFLVLLASVKAVTVVPRHARAPA
jgi:heme A synthase